MVARGRHGTWTKGMDTNEINYMHDAESAQSFSPVESVQVTHQPAQASSRMEEGTAKY